MENRKWEMENRKWGMENRKWGMGDRNRILYHDHFLFPHSLSTNKKGHPIPIVIGTDSPFRLETQQNRHVSLNLLN